MKKFFLTLFAVAQFLALPAQADIFDIIGGALNPGVNRPGRPGRPGFPGRPGRPGRPDRPGHPGYPGQPPYGGNVQCSYRDEGWEEHSRPHYSCGECLSQHGNCVESCYTEQYVCRAVGFDYSGRQQMVMGYGQDRWSAERNAYDTCSYNNLGSCRIDRCDTDRQNVSQRMCR